MSDSTANLDQVLPSQAQKETSVNAVFDAASPATTFGRRASTSVLLTFGYYGGRFNGTAVANGTIAVAASNTSYIVAHRTTLAVTVATTTTNWLDTATYGRMYKVVAGASSITSYEDHRAGTGSIVTAAAMVVLAPVYAAAVTIDLASYNASPIVVVNVGALTGNVTLNITNGVDGQVIQVRLTQDATGSRIFTAGANLRFSTTTPSPVLTTTASKLDRLTFEWHSAAGKADLTVVNKGY